MKRTTILFLLKDNQVLLAMKKRGFGEGRYNGVGGKVEAGETLVQAITRECQEEIGVTPTRFHKAAVIIFDEQHRGMRETIQVNAFVGDQWKGEPVETEEMKPCWFPQDALPYDEMWADDPYWLPLIFQGKLVRASFTLDDNDQVTKKSVKIVKSI